MPHHLGRCFTNVIRVHCCVLGHSSTVINGNCCALAHSCTGIASHCCTMSFINVLGSFCSNVILRSIIWQQWKPLDPTVVCLFFNDASQWLKLLSVEWRSDKRIMNWKGCGRKRYWPNSWYYLSICLEGLMKTTKPLGHDSWSLGRDWTRDLPNTKSYFRNQLVPTMWTELCVQTAWSARKVFFAYVSQGYLTKRYSCAAIWNGEPLNRFWATFILEVLARPPRLFYAIYKLVSNNRIHKFKIEIR
jgi:hypothetical protein